MPDSTRRKNEWRIRCEPPDEFERKLNDIVERASERIREGIKAIMAARKQSPDKPTRGE